MELGREIPENSSIPEFSTGSISFEYSSSALYSLCWISFTDGKLHQLIYTLTDSKGNRSTLAFNVQADAKSTVNTPTPKPGLLFPFSKANEFVTEDIKIILPKGHTFSPHDIEENIGFSKDFNNFELRKAIGEKIYIS